MVHLDDLAAQLALKQHGTISAAQALAAGFTRPMINGRRARGAWRPLLAGTYLVDAWAYPPTWAELPFETRLAAAMLSHGPRAVAVLGTAARIHGFTVVPREDVIHLRLPPGGERHQQLGVRLHTWKVDAEDIMRSGGIPVTSPERTVADLLRTCDRFDAVSVLDGALNAGLIKPEQLTSLKLCIAGLRGAINARERIGECNGLAESALETRIRLIAADAGLAPKWLQYPVYNKSGVLLGRGDMAWERPRRPVLIAEADGADVHGRPAALYRDRRRANDFLSSGDVEVVRFTWEDTLRPAYIVSILLQNLRPS